MKDPSRMLKCLLCHRAGPDLGTCGSFMTCPGRDLSGKGAPIDPASRMFPAVDQEKDIVVSCASCNKTAAVPVYDLLTGKTRVDFRCPTGKENCKALVQHPPQEPAGAVPKGHRAHKA